MHRHLELLAVLGGGDGLGVGADQLDAVARRARRARRSSMARLSAVWPPRVGRTASGRSRSMIAREDVDVERLDVGGVGELGVGHDRRRVRVGEDHAVALLAQHPAGLRARVVELAGLADDDRARSRSAGSTRCRSRRGIYCGSGPSASSNSVEQVADVVGPGPGLGVVLHAEGRRARCARSPSITPSLRLTWVTSARRRASPATTAKLWFWLVISTAPVGEVAHRVVAAVVAERQLVRCRRRAPAPAAGGRGRCRRPAPRRAGRRMASTA